MVKSESSSTTIIFVPGAWHTPDYYDGVARRLRDQGYRTNYVYLASVGKRKEYVQGITPDVKVIRKHVLRAADAGQKVVLVMHSYAGICGTEAAYQLGWQERQAAGRSGGIIHLFYITAFLLRPGTRMLDLQGGQDAPWWSISEDRTSMTVKNPKEIFYGDLPEDTQKLAIARLQPQAYGTCLSKFTHPSWEVIPSTYLYCSQDPGITLELQQTLLRNVGEQYFRTETIAARHFPMYSKPDEVAKAIARAAEIDTVEKAP